MQNLVKSALKTQVPKFNFSNQVSVESLQHIKNSIPLLQAKGGEISNTFYQKEVFPKNISFFTKNTENQARQSNTLAQFLVILAQRAENLEKMNTHFNRVSAKHAGFGIQPEHYPVFQEGITSALKQHGAKPAEVSAWGELLAVVAKSLQESEADHYQELKNTVGGWTGVRSFTVEKVEDLGKGFKSLYVKATDGKPIATFKGGQYLTLKAELPGLGEQYRHVPICNTANKHEYYRLTAPNSTNTGKFLQSKVAGDKIELLPPSGEFTLQGRFNDVVLIGTQHSNLQLIQIANSAQGRNVYYIQIVNNQTKDELKFFFEKYQKLNPNWKTLVVNTDEQEFNYQTVKGFAPVSNADYYFCSPDPAFAKNVNSVLQTVGVPEKNLFYEFEGPYEFLH